MAIKGIGTHGSTAYIKRLNSQLSDLHVQLASGKKAQTYGLMGNDRNIALRMRSDIQLYEGYNEAIKRGKIHLSAVQNILNSLGDINQNARADFNGTAMSLHDGTYSQVKLGAEQRLKDGISLINERISGRYLFSGIKAETEPVETISNILNGIGVKAGLKQVIAERKLADLGALDNGRLTVGLVVNQVNLAEDGVHNFGLKIANITHNVTGVTANMPVVAPQTLSVDFTGSAPVDGEEITIKFTLPDGEDIDITLTARTAGVTDKTGFIIGGTDAANAVNFETAINAALDFLAKGEMMGASAVLAGDGFFADPPQRVDGPPFDTAVAMIDGTSANTLSWYNGDNAPGGEREGYKIFASKHSVLNVGSRADEEPLRDFVKNLSLMVAESFDPASETSNAHYGALKIRLTAGLSDSATKVSLLELSTELGYKEKHLENLQSRNEMRVHMSKNILSDVEEADVYEVSAKLLALKAQLEISYKTTSVISQIHLLNFL